MEDPKQEKQSAELKEGVTDDDLMAATGGVRHRDERINGRDQPSEPT
ncbi:hypothetical protein SynBIOSE41_01683 [Synechococcus sp. BIOS-E4-1]|nr:hypothetical protein SynBIOSE41_01683 [Synechococcus sp. BIOS-E4-1]